MVEQQETVTRMEDILKEASAPVNTEFTCNNSKMSKANKRVQKSFEQQIPKGRPKSGRIWKEQKTRFSSVIKSKGLHLSLEKKRKLKEDLKRVKELSKAIKDQKQAEKEAKKQRRLENLRRAEENRKRGEVVQVIKNTTKIKRMKKKQLRSIEKRDTNDM